MTPETGKQIIAIHILLNISSRKGNQAMKLGQLPEYNMRKIFLENHLQNEVEKLFSEPFLENQNFYSLFLLYAKLRPTKIN